MQQRTTVLELAQKPQWDLSHENTHFKVLNGKAGIHFSKDLPQSSSQLTPKRPEVRQASSVLIFQEPWLRVHFITLALSVSTCQHHPELGSAPVPQVPCLTTKQQTLDLRSSRVRHRSHPRARQTAFELSAYCRGHHSETPSKQRRRASDPSPVTQPQSRTHFQYPRPWERDPTSDRAEGPNDWLVK